MSETISEAMNRRRTARRQRRLGPDASCALCGEKNPEMLTKVSRTILQAHHIAGVANDVEATVVLCLNCHAKVTAKQYDVGMSFSKPASLLDKAVSILKSLAALFYMIGDMLVALAAQLAELLRALKEKYPEYRSMPEAAP